MHQSSGMDVHTAELQSTSWNDQKSIIAMNEIKQANIVTFAVSLQRGTSGGTYASVVFSMHDIIIS